jgi:hypothetical protein
MWVRNSFEGGTVGDIGLRYFAEGYDVDSIGGIAQAAGKTWPPPPPVYARSLLSIIAVPPEASVFQLEGPVYGAKAGEIAYGLNWENNGFTTPVAATSWKWSVADGVGNRLKDGSVPAPGVSPVSGVFEEGGSYTWTVTGVNAYGAGHPATYSFQAAHPSGPPPPASAPTLTATIASDNTVTVSGDHFNDDKTVYIQATVEGISTTPNTTPNNVPDARNQVSQVTADGSGSFKGVVITPQGFGSILFENGKTVYVWAGETIAIVAANANVGNYSPGPGVSSIVKLTAKTTV